MRMITLWLLLTLGVCGQAVRLVPYVTPDTPQGAGPFPAIMEQSSRLPTHTVYRPKNLAGQKLPIIAWGNGACVNVGNRFRYFLTEIASNGFMVIALGPIGSRGRRVSSTTGGCKRGSTTCPTGRARNPVVPVARCHRLGDGGECEKGQFLLRQAGYFQGRGHGAILRRRAGAGSSRRRSRQIGWNLE